MNIFIIQQIHRPPPLHSLRKYHIVIVRSHRSIIHIWNNSSPHSSQQPPILDINHFRYQLKYIDNLFHLPFSSSLSSSSSSTAAATPTMIDPPLALLILKIVHYFLSLVSTDMSTKLNISALHEKLLSPTEESRLFRRATSLKFALNHFRTKLTMLVNQLQQQQQQQQRKISSEGVNIDPTIIHDNDDNVNNNANNKMDNTNGQKNIASHDSDNNRNGDDVNTMILKLYRRSEKHINNIIHILTLPDHLQLAAAKIKQKINRKQPQPASFSTATASLSSFKSSYPSWSPSPSAAIGSRQK